MIKKYKDFIGESKNDWDSELINLLNKCDFEYSSFEDFYSKGDYDNTATIRKDGEVYNLFYKKSEEERTFNKEQLLNYLQSSC